MFYYIPTTGDIKKISREDAILKMDEISPQWEDERTADGTVSLGVFDWKATKSGNSYQLHIPMLRKGGSIPLNSRASNICGFSIYGDCIFRPKEDFLEQMEKLSLDL